MNKAEAQARIGQRVSAWTASSGVYVGTLAEVISEKGRPWRGRVRITGVLEVACHWQIGCSGPIRKGFRPGDEIEVGGVNIKPTTQGRGLSYRPWALAFRWRGALLLPEALGQGCHHRRRHL